MLQSGPENPTSKQVPFFPEAPEAALEQWPFIGNYSLIIGPHNPEETIGTRNTDDW